MNARIWNNIKKVNKWVEKMRPRDFVGGNGRRFPGVCADFGRFGGRLNWGEKCVALNIPPRRCRIVPLLHKLLLCSTFIKLHCIATHSVFNYSIELLDKNCTKHGEQLCQKPSIWDQVVPNYNYDTVYQALQWFIIYSYYNHILSTNKTLSKEDKC